MFTEKILSQFDEFLDKRNLNSSAVVIGEDALLLMSAVSMATQDDVLDPDTHPDAKKASEGFAKIYNSEN